MRLSLGIRILLAALVLIAISGEGRAASEDVVRVGVWEVPPFAMRDSSGNWSGVTVELWEEVADRLGLRYEIKEYSHHQLFDALADKEVDVALSDIPITHKYGNAIEYSRAYLHSNLAVAGRVKTRPVLERIVQALTSPAVLTVIGALGLLVLVGGLVFWFLSEMSSAVAEHNGVVDKFVGDAVMAFYGPPFVAADRHGAEACLVALDQVRSLVELRRGFPDIGELDIKIGVSSGDLVVGNIGSDSLRSHTVVGDTVNLAARLESLNKTYGTRILISERTRELAGDAIETREIDRVTVRGKTAPTRVYEVLAAAGGMSPEQASLRDRFEAGLAAFQAGDRLAAGHAFEDCLKTDPEDTPVRIYLERCREGS